MNAVVPLLQPIGADRLRAALDEIVDASTEAVVIVTLGDVIGVRSFGHPDKCRMALVAAERADDGSKIAELERALDTLRSALDCVARTASCARDMSIDQLAAPAERYPKEI